MLLKSLETVKNSCLISCLKNCTTQIIKSSVILQRTFQWITETSPQAVSQTIST